MLYDFLSKNRSELVKRCAAKAAQRALPGAKPPAGDYGIPQFISQLTETFRVEQTPEAVARHRKEGHGRPSLVLVPADIPSTAAKHGIEMRQEGLTIDQVVHNYGDLCQALTELALERDEPISVDEFHTFNRCLDDAIADAVTAYSDHREGVDVSAPNATSMAVAEQMRNMILTAIVSFAAIKNGNVGLNGTTSALHEKTLANLRDLFESVMANGPAAGEGEGLRAIISPAAPR
jgi:hypothetical protein